VKYYNQPQSENGDNNKPNNKKQMMPEGEGIRGQQQQQRNN
jgi:hypothetical protein